MKSSLAIPLAILAGGIIVAVAVYASQPKAPSKSIGDTASVRPVSASDHILGNPAAPVVIIEYSDFDCDFCKGFHDTLRQIVANEGASGKVAGNSLTLSSRLSLLTHLVTENSLLQSASPAMASHHVTPPPPQLLMRASPQTARTLLKLAPQERPIQLFW
ncbi:thioredoxin domain-containing protein [Candidatus Kaiserbacteria bacterium]|nr:thioredoxin domain-containing protein [Candidatus Kaiserbacteria bacterium]